MDLLAKVEVTLKPGLSDPEGKASAEALMRLGYEVDEVQVGKIYYIHLKAESEDKAQEKLDEMCSKLFANPIKDDYRIEVVPSK
jgi:phosphoribosylformylglycinamidine synthase